MMSPRSAFKELSAHWGVWLATGHVITLVCWIFFPDFVTLPLVLTLMGTLFKARAAGFWTRARAAVHGPLTWMAALFLLYVIGLAWSTNMDYAAFDLQVKAPMLAVPVVLLLLPVERWRGGRELLNLFGWSCVLASAICIIVAFTRFGIHVWGSYVTGDMGELTSSYLISTFFSLFMHPSYFAMYLLFALMIQDDERRRSGSARRPSWDRLPGVILLLGILLSASKAGWLAYAGYWCAMCWVERKQPPRLRRRLVQGGVLILALMVLSTTSSFFREKIEQFKAGLKGEAPDVSAEGSTESRELIWEVAVQLIKRELPWGTGTGDVKDALIAEYRQRGMAHALDMRLNAHDQWVQTTLTLGYLGALLLLLMVLVPFITAVRSADVLAAGFFVLLAWNWVAESMLETQAGTLFLAWGALLISLRSVPSAQVPAHDPVQPAAHR